MLYHKTYVKNENLDWVVFVHGAGGSSALWFKQIREYQKHFNLVLIDLRGHGKSQGENFKKYINSKYSFEEVSKDILEVLNFLSIKKAHFVGVSLGTIIIRAIAELEESKIKSMVLGGAIARLNFRSKFLMTLAAIIKKIIPFMWLYAFYAHILMPNKRNKESRNLFIREARNVANKEFLKWFKLTAELSPLLNYFYSKEPNIPTLYIMGEEDAMFLPYVKKVVEKHKQAILKILKSCGHVVNVEKPQLFNTFSIEFMKGIK